MTDVEANEEALGFWTKLERMDPRILHWLVFLCILAPLIFPMGLPIKISSGAVDAWTWLEENIEEGDVVFSDLSGSYGLSAETGGGMAVLMKFLWERGAGLIVIGGQEDAPVAWDKYFNLMKDKAGGVYGENYVDLGYIPSKATFLAAAVDDFWGAMPRDKFGNLMEDLPMMARVRTASDLKGAYIMSFTGCQPIYVRYWVTSGPGLPLIFHPAGTEFPEAVTLYQAGLAVGALSGIRGSAEIEKLSGNIGEGAAQLDCVSLTLSIPLFAVIITNVGYIYRKYVKGEEIR